MPSWIFCRRHRRARLQYRIRENLPTVRLPCRQPAGESAILDHQAGVEQRFPFRECRHPQNPVESPPPPARRALRIHSGSRQQLCALRPRHLDPDACRGGGSRQPKASAGIVWIVAYNLLEFWKRERHIAVLLQISGSQFLLGGIVAGLQSIGLR